MTQAAAVGRKIATVRESLNVSIDQLAERSGCDCHLIQQIEGGERLPSLAPLIKITRALGVRLGTMLDDAGGLGPVVTRREQAKGVVRLRSLETGSGDLAGTLDFFSLGEGKATRHMEPFLVTVHPGDAGPASSHEGEELLYVLAGSINVTYGKGIHTLGPGDSIFYDSVVPHLVEALGDEAAQLLAVVYAPA